MMLRWEITSRGYSEISQQANVLIFFWGHSSEEPQQANSEKSQKLVNETTAIKTHVITKFRSVQTGGGFFLNFPLFNHEPAKRKNTILEQKKKCFGFPVPQDLGFDFNLLFIYLRFIPQ